MTDLADLIRHDAPLRYGAGAVYPFKHLIEKNYRFVSRYDDEVLLHRRDGDTIVLPRALCPPGGNDCRTRGLPAHFPKKPVPRDNQVKLLGEAIDCLDAGLSGLICAYTGWGKTWLGFAMAYHVQRKTLVVTTKDDIYAQWIEKAQTILGVPRARIGEIRGDKVQVQGRDFVVAMIHTLSKDGRLPPELATEFGLVIFDECHRLPADSFSSVAYLFDAYWRWGLSATPERSDGKSLLLHAHLGPIRAATEAQLMVPKVLRFHSGWQCPRVIRKDPKTAKERVVRLPHEPGKTTHIEKIIAADPERNKMVAELILTAHQKGRRTVVFSTLHEHLNSLHRAAIAMGISGKEMGFYASATTKAERAAREKVKVRPIIFTTFSMMGEGTSIDWLDCGILAMPRSGVEQPCGRIRREFPDKPDPVWMDVVDGDSPVLSGYAASRRQWYESIGAVVKVMN